MIKKSFQVRFDEVFKFGHMGSQSQIVMFGCVKKKNLFWDFYNIQKQIHTA